jgi:hypothetical protein
MTEMGGPIRMGEGGGISLGFSFNIFLFSISIFKEYERRTCGHFFVLPYTNYLC